MYPCRGILGMAQQLVLVLVFMAFSISTKAQADIASYSLTQSTGTYTPITGGTALIAANANYDNQISSAIVIPAFPFGGVNIDTVFVHANGYITFGAAHSGSTYTPLSTAGTNIKGVVSAYGVDLGCSAASNQTAGATHEIRYQQIGDEFVAQWTDVKRYNLANERLTFQIRLNSTTGSITIIYGPNNVPGNSTTYGQIGIRGNSTAWATNVNNLRLVSVLPSGPCSWTNILTANANSGTVYYNSDNLSAVPATGMKLVWAPPGTAVAPVRTFKAVSNITSNGAKIGWSPTTGATRYEVHYRKLNECAWTSFSGNPVTDTFAVLTGLSAATIYNVEVRASNATDASIWSHTPNAAGSGDGYATTGTFNTNCEAPQPTTATSNNTSVCFGDSVTVSIPSIGTTSTLSYKWQKSYDGTTYTDIASSNSITLKTVADAKFFRCMVKCSSGPDSIYSAPAQINYVQGPGMPADKAHCGPDEFDLTVVQPAAASFTEWYSSVSNRIPIDTGITFHTPLIVSNKTYYAASAYASTGNVRIGNGTSATSSTSYPNPLSAYYGGTKHQMLFRASELLEQNLRAGAITSLSFDLKAFAASQCNDLTIRLGQTLNDSINNSFIAGAVPVYNGSFTPSAAGIVTFTFTTPFIWDGRSNLIVETVHNAGNSGNGSGTTHTYTTTSFRSVYVTYADNISPGTAAGFDAASNPNTTYSSDRPNVIFGGRKVCLSMKEPANIVINAAPAHTLAPKTSTICNNVVKKIQFASTSGNYNEVTWSPAANLYMDSATTVPYVAGSHASTVFFKSATANSFVRYVKAVNTTSDCKVFDTVVINVLPAAIKIKAAKDTLCHSGSTLLSIVSPIQYGNPSYQWQSATGTTFGNINNAVKDTCTPPVFSTTSYFKLILKDDNGTQCTVSPIDTVTVSDPNILSSAGASRCGPGSLQLTATASGGSIYWFDSPTSFTSVGQGTTFNTPSISADKTYYVEAQAGRSNANFTIGTGNLVSVSGSPDYSGTSPFAYHYGNYKNQMLVLASELIAQGMQAGPIYSVALDVVSKGTASTFNNFTVSLLPTNISAMTTNFVTGSTSAISTSAAYSPTIGINTFTFATPFMWDGVTNIVVQTCYNNNNNGDVSSSAEVRCNTTSFVSHTIKRADGTNNNICGDASGNSNGDGPTISKRPKLIFNGTVSCSSTRVPVLAKVNAKPSVAVTPSSSANVCVGGQVALTTTNTTDSLQWTKGGAAIPGAHQSSYQATSGGTYKLIAVNTTTGCLDSSAAITVTSRENPVVNLGNDTSICSGNSLVLNAGNAGSTFAWENNATTQTRTITQSGTYSVKVTNTYGCITKDTIAVVVNPLPVVNLGRDTMVCEGTPYVIFAGNTAGYHYLWSDNSIGNTNTVNTTGDYWVRVTNTYNCRAYDTVSVTYFPIPSVNLGGTAEACMGDVITLNAGNPGESYLWDDLSTAQTRTVNATGNYHVSVTNIAHCTGYDTISVTFHDLPVVALGNDTVFCHGNVLVLDAGNNGSTYLWNDHTTARTHEVGATGSYSVTVTDQYGCVSSDAINVEVKELPSGRINAVHGDTATYTFNVLNARYVSDYTWDFGDGSPLAYGPWVQHRYHRDGIYLVKLILNGECDDQTLEERTVDVFGAGVGIIELTEDKHLLLYPNPGKDIVTIEQKEGLRLQHISVFNVLGQRILYVKADNPDTHKLNVHSWAPGLYTVQIETDKGIAVRKLEILR